MNDKTEFVGLFPVSIGRIRSTGSFLLTVLLIVSVLSAGLGEIQLKLPVIKTYFRISKK